MVLIDAGDGNNGNFMQKLEEKNLKYIGDVAKNRKVVIRNESGEIREIRLDELAKSLLAERWSKVETNLEKAKNVWVATFTAEISQLEGERTLAIVMNASSVEEATDIDYLMTNVSPEKATAEWIGSRSNL